MKKCKALIINSLILCLASLATIFVPNLKATYSSADIGYAQVVADIETFDRDLNTTNYGAIPRRKLITDNYSVNAKAISSESLPSSFDLSSEINIEVKNQESYGICYSFATLSALETTIAKCFGEYYNFSEIYAPYAKALAEGKTSVALLGGNFEDIVEVANGSGLALEAEMPYPTFTHSGSTVTITNDYGTRTTLGDGLYSYSGLTEEQILAIENTSKTVELNNAAFFFPSSASDTSARRTAIKNHIYNYGAVYADFYAGTATDLFTSYYNSSTGVYKYTGSAQINHAITLIGWDDTKGAYLALNSWGKDWGNNGCFYISYDDVHIENGVCGFMPEGIKFNKEQDVKTVVTNGEYCGFASIPGYTYVFTILKNTEAKDLYVDKIFVPLNNSTETISLDYKIVSSFDSSVLKNGFTNLLSNVVPGNAYLTESSSSYVNYCIELETPIVLPSGKGLAFKFKNASASYLIDCYTEGTCTNNVTYFYKNSFAAVTLTNPEGTISYDAGFGIQLAYKDNMEEYSLEVGTLNDSVTSNYIDYFSSNGGAIYIPIGVEDESKSYSSYNVQIQKLSKLGKTLVSSGYAIKHSKVSANFDSDSDGVLDRQNIYIEFSSMPAVGSYVATVGYGDKAINKYFEIVQTSSEKQLYTILYNTGSSVTNDNPTKFYEGWQNVILSNLPSNGKEFGNWSVGGTPVTEIQTNAGDVQVTANWVGADAELSVTLNEIEDFTYDGTNHIISANVTNTFDETNYTEEVIEWFKDDGVDAVAYGNELIIRDVEDSGTYKCCVTLYNGEANPVAVAEAETTISVSPKAFSIYPAASYSKKYNEQDPEFQYSYSGAVSGETPAFTGSLSREAGNNVGTYNITQGSLNVVDNGAFKASNYLVSFTNQNNYLQINKATLIVGIESAEGVGDQTITYGDAEPTVWLNVISGVKDGETAVILGEIERESGNSVGEYIYGVRSLALDSINGTAIADNYSLVLETVKLKIMPREVTLSVTIDGEAYSSPIRYNGNKRVAEVVLGNVVNSDSVSVITTSSTFEATEVGTYYINISGLSNSNYVLPETHQLKWQIIKAVASVSTPSLLSATYGDKLLDVELPAGWAWDLTAYDANTVVGNVVAENIFRAIYTPADTNNYEGTTANVTISVGQKQLNVIPSSNVIKKFGASEPIIPFIFEGYLTGETPVYNGVLGREQGETAGSYEFTLGTLALQDGGTFLASNYALQLFDTEYKFYIGALTVSLTGEQTKEIYDGQALTIEVEGTSSTYPSGYYNAELYIWYKVMVGGSKVEVKRTETREDAQLALKNVADSGTYECYFAVYKNNVLVDSTTAQTAISIGARQLSVAPSKSYEKGYGEADSVIEYSYDGQLDGETPSFQGALSRTSGEAVGTYLINQGSIQLVDNDNFKASNYNLIFNNVNNHNLTIKKATLLLKISSNFGDGDQTKIYGDSDPLVSLVVVSGLKAGETAHFQNSVSRAQGENVGEYDYSIAGVTLISGPNTYANPNNYDLMLEPTKLTITQRTISLTLYVDGVVYTEPVVYTGEEKVAEIRVGNKVGSDEVSIETLNSSLKATNVGTYSINVDSVDNSNYTLPNEKDFTWQIAKATPTFERPILTATYGDKLFEVEADNNWVWDASYDENTLVGNVGKNIFNVTYIPDDADNYNEVQTYLEVQVGAKKLTITPVASYKIYDGIGGIHSNLTFEIDENDLVEGEEAKTSGNLTRENIENENVGTYEILIGTLKLEDNGNFKKSNYEIEFVTGVLYEIKPINISLKFENYENLYFDGTTKTIKVTFENKILNDDIEIVLKNEKLEENEVNAISIIDGNICVVNKGIYDIEIDSISGSDSSNYIFPEELDIEFEVRNATITIVPNFEQGKTYGEADGDLNYTYTGAMDGQVPKFEGSLSRVPGENVGNYAIVLGSLKLSDNDGFIASNYELKLSSTKVYYAVKPRMITLSANENATEISKIFDGFKDYKNTSNILFGEHFKALDGCILEGDLEKVSVLVSNATFDSKFASIDDKSGAQKLTISGFTLFGTGISNYVLDTSIKSLDIKGKINPVTLTVVATAQNRDFNGTNKVVINFSEPQGLVDGYPVQLNPEQKSVLGTLTSVNVGTYNYLNGQITVSKPSLIDESGNNFETNYTVELSDFSVKIFAKEITNEDVVWVKGSKAAFIDVDENSFIYNAKNQFEQLLAYYERVDGEKHWLDLAVWNGETFKNAGEYTIEVSNSDSNYSLTLEALSRKITIQKQELSIVLDKEKYEKIYDNSSEIDVTFHSLTGIVEHDDVYLFENPTKLVANLTNVGIYSFKLGNLDFNVEIKLMGGDANNYMFVAPDITFEIKQKVIETSDIIWMLEESLISMEDEALELDYTGINYLNNLTARINVDGVIYNLALEVVTGEDSIKDVGTYQVRAISQAGENIGISENNPIIITIKIDRKELNINLLTQSKIYDGTTYVPVVSYNLNGVVAGDLISIDEENLTVTTKSKNAGTNLPVLINGNESHVLGILDSLILGTGTSLENYNIFVNAPNITIEQKVVSPIWGSAALIYNGAEQVPNCSLNGVIEGDNCNGIFDGYTKNVTIAPVVANIRAIDNSNYKLSTDNTSISFTISKARIKIKTTDISVPEGSEPEFSFEIVEGTLYEGDDLHITYETKEIKGEDFKYKITAQGFNSNYEIEYEFGTMTEIPVNRTFVILVFGFIVGFFVVEIIIIRVKAIKKEKSKPTLKKAEGEGNGNNE